MCEPEQCFWEENYTQLCHFVPFLFQYIIKHKLDIQTWFGNFIQVLSD